MPTLPDIPYTDRTTQKASTAAAKKVGITKFGGIRKNAGEGAMYDGLNVSGDNYPYLATRMGFARVGLKKDGAAYTPDFSVKATVMLADGSGIVYVGTTKAAIHTFATGTVEVISYGKTINVVPESVVSVKRTATIEAKSDVTYDYSFYITFILSAKFVISKRVRKTRGSSAEDARFYVGSLGNEWTRQVASGYLASWYKLLTWFGNDFGNSSSGNPDPAAVPSVNNAHPPIYLSADQSVISAADVEEGDTVKELKPFIVPGLYASVTKESADPVSGLILDGFYSTDEEVVLKYSGGDIIDNNRTMVKLNSIVFQNDAGFKPNTRQLEVGSPSILYYSPPFTTGDDNQGKYKLSLGDLPDNIRGGFVLDKRLWAYDEHTIYVSAAGRYEIFTVDGTDMGGWSVTLPVEGVITGGISYAGRPVFFTESEIITVYGGYPSAYSLRIDDGWGVEYNSGASLKICGGSLYYLSKAGIMRYSGNTPVCISAELTRVQLTDGRAETDSRYYMLYARQLKTRTGEPTGFLYVYDTFRGEWHQWQYLGTSGINSHITTHNELITDPTFCYAQYEPDDISHIVMTVGGANTFTVVAVPTFERQKLIFGAVTRETNGGYYGYNDSYFWGARFGPFYLGTPNYKTLKALHLRARLISQPRVDGATLNVKVCYDDADAALNGRYIEDSTGFTSVYTATEAQNAAVAGDIYADRNIYIPLQPRRCKSFKLEISGTERWEISDLSFEYSISTER